MLDQRRRLTATLKEHIVNHDPLAERELDRVLRSIERELAKWMETAGPRATVPIELLPPKVEIGHLRERLWDPASATPPPPLEEVKDDTPEPPTIAELRMRGGPSLDELRTALVDAFTSGEVDTVGQLFNDLPPNLRRPVEILGLLHIASRIDALRDDTGAEVFEAIRPNGTRRNFLVPTVSPTPANVAALAGISLEGTAE